MTRTDTTTRPAHRATDVPHLSRRALLGGLGTVALGLLTNDVAHATPRGASQLRQSASSRFTASASVVRRCTGLGARSFATAQRAQRNIISFVVIDFEWHQLHAGPGKVDTAFRDELRRQLDWCASQLGVTGKPLQVRLRPRMGMYAPQWVKNSTGVMRWYTDKGTDGTGASAPSDPAWREIEGGVPVWWNAAYASAATDLYAIIAREFGSHRALAEVAMGWPSTQFVEPCNKQFGLVENVRAAAAKGYTDALDDAMFLKGWQAHKALLSPYGIGCYTAFNPPGSVVSGTFRFGNVERCVRLMRTEVATLGPTAVVANNSWAPLSTQSGEYRTMYGEHQRLRSSGTRIGFQTETFEKLSRNTTVRAAIEEAVTFRASGVELPRGCESASGQNLVDPAYARTVCLRFALN